MKGDRIIVSKSSMMGQSTEEVFQVYKPKFNPDGSLMTGYDGGVILEKSGGVKGGSTGYIADEPVMVQRTQLQHLQNEPTSIGGRDVVAVFPVYFDDYKLVGWIPADHFRVVGGSAPVQSQKR